MRRRTFLSLLTASAAAPFSTVGAQQAARTKVVGLVSAFSEAEMKPLRAVFTEKLRSLGWQEGDNLELDFRLTGGKPEDMAVAAGALSERHPDVIVAQGSPEFMGVRKNAGIVPVIFLLVADPVGQGLIQSLSRPGGNLTGFTNFEFSVGSKWVELIREISPATRRIVLIANPGNSASTPFSDQIESASRSIGLDIRTVDVRNASEIETAIRGAAGSPPAALITLPDFLPVVNRDLIVSLTNQLGIPSIHPFRTFPVNGGLMSYGLDFPDLYRQVAIYVDRVLRGEKPANLPVQAPNKFELVVNLKTARLLGIEVPQPLLTGADELIE
jgi:putative tryptophan/tyrosine transport system substrate-binding protein